VIKHANFHEPVGGGGDEPANNHAWRNVTLQLH
jgi:hypothetical protein